MAHNKNAFENASFIGCSIKNEKQLGFIAFRVLLSLTCTCKTNDNNIGDDDDCCKLLNDTQCDSI